MKVTVCMAVYNGEDYLEEQLKSIFEQSVKVDELIIVDDCSSDKSHIIIENYSHLLPMKYHRNDINLGVISSFELALSFASGDYIFLSDQDDIWEFDKVEVFIDGLNNKKNGLCISNYNVIDKNGNMKNSPSNFKDKQFDLFKAVYKNSFIGCSMAFHKNLLKYILPFPRCIPMHDSWIGLCAKVFSNVYIINKPVLRYRRHGANVTGKRLPLITALLHRICLVTNLLKRIFKVKWQKNIR